MIDYTKAESSFGIPLVNKALKFAVEAHDGQYRKGSGIPYVTHCVEVMKRLVYYGIDSQEILAAALLHDVVEDCEVKVEDIEKEFGKQIATWVDECSRAPELDSQKGKVEFLKSFVNKSAESVIIKIADRWCNVHDFIIDFRENYANWYALQAYPLYEEKHRAFKLLKQPGFLNDDVAELTRMGKKSLK